MADRLFSHKAEKKAAVNGWDLLSMGMGGMGACLLCISISQPKNPFNQFRLPGALVLLASSVVVERFREVDLESLTKAEEYEKAIKSEEIRRDVIRSQVLRDVDADQMVFRRAPRSMWGELSARLQLNPPPEPEPEYAQQQEPIVQSVAVVDRMADPCESGYDPEPDEDKNSGFSFIPAPQVKDWFLEMLDKGVDIKSLVDEWAYEPGIGIQIKDGIAKVMRGGD